MMTWREFRSQFPTGLVLQPAHTKSEAASDTDEPADVDYAIEPYDAYFESDGFGLAAHRDEAGQRAWDRNDIAPKTIVLGVTIGNEAVGFPQPAVVNEGGLVRTTVGGAKIIVVAVDGQLHAFEDPGVPLTIQAGVIEGNGTTWNPVTGKSPRWATARTRTHSAVVCIHLAGRPWSRCLLPNRRLNGISVGQAPQAALSLLSACK